VTEQVKKKLSDLPHKPGVYLMKDRFGTVIYVGKARDLRKRVTQYFHPSRRMGWDLKFNALVEAIHDLDVHVVRNDPEAVLLEGKLIKEFHPRYNVSFRDDKRFLLLKVNLNDPIPRFTPHTAAAGRRRALFRAVRQFGRAAQHADHDPPEVQPAGVPPADADRGRLQTLFVRQFKFCTAPCIGNVTREQYLQQVLAACDFLSGQCEEMQEQLEAEMKSAAVAQDFEKAAALRDALADLRRTTQKTRQFPRLPYTLPVAIDPQRDLEELAAALQLPAPPERIEGFDISNISGTFAVASMVSFRNGRPDRSNYRRFKMKTVVGQDDFASMAETVRRRYTRVLREAAESEQTGGRQTPPCPAQPHPH
jgi:excinuclease ABC subunit C